MVARLDSSVRVEYPIQHALTVPSSSFERTSGEVCSLDTHPYVRCSIPVIHLYSCWLKVVPVLALFAVSNGMVSSECGRLVVQLTAWNGHT